MNYKNEIVEKFILNLKEIKNETEIDTFSQLIKDFIFFEVENFWDNITIIQKSILHSIKLHNIEFSKMVINLAKEYNVSIDIGMMNYLASECDSEAFNIYSNIVDITKYDKNREDDCDFILSFIRKGRKKDVLQCIKKGINISKTKLFFTALESLQFDDARFYFENFKIKISKKKWDKFLGDIAFYSFENDAIKIFKEIEKYNFKHPIIGYKPIKIIGRACQNNHTEVADFLYKNGSPLFHEKKNKDPMFLARQYKNAVKWLLDKGVSPKKHGAEILKVLIYKKDSKDVVLEIISKMNKKDVPWLDMLLNAADSDPSDCISKIKFLKSIHFYSKKDFRKAYEYSSKNSFDKWNCAREYLEKECSVEIDEKLILNIIKNGNEKAQSKIAIKLFERVNFSEEGLKNILAFASRDIIYRGGYLTMIEKIFEINNKLKVDDVTLKFINNSRREDLKEILNKHK